MREGFYVGFSVYFYLIDRIFVNLDFKPAIYGGTNFLREFIFADWRFLVIRRN